MDYQQRVLEVLVYVQNHLDDELTVDNLSEQAGFSPYHFHRLFRGVVGETMMGFVRRLRLERAAFRLMHTSEPVAALALEAGYSSAEPFSRMFRKSFGLSPSAFRERHGRKWHLPAEIDLHYENQGRPEFRGKDLGIKVTLERLPELQVVCNRFTGPYLEALPCWRPLQQWATQNGREVRPEHRLGICYDDPGLTEPSRLRYDGCLVVEGEVKVEAPLFVQTVWGGPCAVYLHEGPYEGLERAYENLLGDWLPNSGRTVRNLPCIESYQVSPFDTDDEAEYRTLICLALE